MRSRNAPLKEGQNPSLPAGVAGYGAGGLLALYAAAVDPRIDAVPVSGYFGPREGMRQKRQLDGIAPESWVAYEFAKVRRLYDQPGIGDRTAVEFFVGGHEVNGKGTFDFLHRHARPLDWPAPR
jgi:hypothetical protein